MGEEVEKLVEQLKFGVSDPALWHPGENDLNLDAVHERLQEAAAALERVERERDEWKYTWEQACELAAEDAVESNKLLRAAEAQVEAMRMALEEIVRQTHEEKSWLARQLNGIAFAALSVPVEEGKGDMVSRDLKPASSALGWREAVNAWVREDLSTGAKLQIGYFVPKLIERLAALASSTPESSGNPLDMILFCPSCGLQHIDEPTAEWPNEAHPSHLCLGCGHIWRPADVATNGVREIETSGQRDNPPIRRVAPAEARSEQAEGEA